MAGLKRDEQSRSLAYSAGPCSVCADGGAALFVVDVDTGRIFYACPACGCAWRGVPEANLVETIERTIDIAALGFRLATHADVAAADLTHSVRAAHSIGWPASFDTPDYLESEKLEAGAMGLMRAHFDALNRGDREAFRETAHLNHVNEGLPFDRWWSGMRSLCPLTLQLAVERIDMPDLTVVADTPSSAPRHASVWIHVNAFSEALLREYSASFVVWYLLKERSWKLGCRVHWWLPDQAQSS